MKKFYLIEKKCGRIVLTPVEPYTEIVLDIINAKNWVSAREEVDKRPYYNTQGHGWLKR
jgi:hypothetical protein